MHTLLKWLPPVCLFFLLPFSVLARDVGVAVLDFELNDLTLDPNTPDELRRTASIKPLLQENLEKAHGYKIIEVDPETQRNANPGFGYLFDRPDAAAHLGRAIGADWVVVGRVHKASFLFVYFKARVINARSSRLAADLIVEVKGPQGKLTVKGVESLAEQISDSIGRGPAQVDVGGAHP